LMHPSREKYPEALATMGSLASEIYSPRSAHGTSGDQEERAVRRDDSPLMMSVQTLSQRCTTSPSSSEYKSSPRKQRRC
jgi:hypothetical protein